MTTQDALNHYGGHYGLAQALKCWPTSIYKWGEYPPKAKQFELQVLTDGQLQVEKDIIDAYKSTPAQLRVNA